MYVYCIGLTIKLALITCTTPVDCVEEGLGVVLQPHRQVVHLPGLACHTQLYKQGVHLILCFSELCQFCCSAGILPVWCVYKH